VLFLAALLLAPYAVCSLVAIDLHPSHWVTDLQRRSPPR
jgi:hypothetical protein